MTHDADHHDRDLRIARFVLGELDEPAAHAVRDELARDADAARVADALRALVARLEEDDTVPPPAELHAWAVTLAPTLRARRVLGAYAVARCIFDSRRRATAAGIRADTDAFRLGFEFDVDAASGRGTIDLQCTPPADPGEPWRIDGQIERQPGGTADEIATAGGVEVGAIASGATEPAATARTEPDGYFMLRLRDGMYDLHLGLPATGVLLPGLRLR